MPREDKVTRKLRAILSADVKGYSLLMADDEAFTVKTLKEYRNLLTMQVEQHNGRVVDSPGDNILADFASAVDAVECGAEIQKVLKEKNDNLPDDKRLEFRIGVNIGDVIHDGDRIYGHGVNVAARIEGLAEPSGICVSRNAYDHIRDKLNYGYEYLGEHEVKNIKRPVRVYKVLLASEDAGKLIGDVPKKTAKKWIWATTVLAVIVITSVTWQVYQKIAAPKFEPASVENMSYPLPNKPSIAVLPFDNMSGDPEQEFFSDGITEEIITALSKTPKMFVIARNSTFTYKGKAVKVQQVAEELGVRYVLEGSVRKSEGQVRITAQLIDALTGEHMWAERYDREFKDIFALQDEVTKEILTALHIKLTDGEQARIYAKGTDNLEAYLKAMQAQWYAYLWTKKGNSEAKRLIEEAVALAPDYAYAHRVLGATHIVDLFVGSSNSPKESLAKAAGAYRKAITLDESLASAYGAMGFVLTMMRKYDEAIRLGKKAVALEPNSADVINMYAAILTYAGMVDEAIPMHRTALRLNPKPPITYYQPFGHALSISGQYEEAIAMLKKAIEQEPDNYNAFIILAASASLAGYDQEARAAVKEILRIDPQFSVKRLIAPFKDRTILRKNCDALNNAGMSLKCDVFPAEEPSIVKSDKPSIAVLAFDNLSGDPEQEYFSDGISEEIISALSKSDKLIIIARNSSFTYKGKPVNVKQVAKELSVRYVLEGSVRKSEDRVRITAQLIDATTGHHLWSERYDRKLTDMFAVQDEITMKIITSLQVELTEGEQLRIWAKKYKRLDVLLKAMELISVSRKGTQESIIRWGQVAQETVDIAPELSVGYRHLGWHHFFLAALGKSPRENLKKAYGFALKAISLDESDSMSHGLLGNVYLRMRQHEKAIAAGKRAVELHPNGADVHMYLGFTLSYAGKPDEAIGYLNKAYRLNPFPPYYIPHAMGHSYLLKGQYEKALTENKKALQLAPKAAHLHAWLARNYILLGREEEAHASAEKALELLPTISVSLFAKTQPYKNQADLEFMLDVMRKVGFPE